MMAALAEHELTAQGLPEVDLPLYVDAAPLRERRLTGIARFVARLIEALALKRPLRLFIPGSEHDIRLDAARLPDSSAGLDDFIRRLWKLPRVRHCADRARHCAGLYTVLRPPQRRFRREIGILYDFTPFVLPKCHVAATRQHFGSFFGRLAALCDGMIAISQSTRNDATWLCSVDPAKIVVNYPGPSLCIHGHLTPAQERRANVMLVVAAVEPRKNGPFVLEWFMKSQMLPPKMELWWVGPTAWWASPEHLHDLDNRQYGMRRVRFLGMVPDRELCALYQQAAWTIYPSLYEGFGFPVLDSLLHNTPVLCSFNSSLQEFRGSGVFHFDPCDPASLDAAWLQASSAKGIDIQEQTLRERYSWSGLANSVLGLAGVTAASSRREREGGRCA
jgi:glycosyltransferase involved in cell wall biosynthesis